jgi:hypothetical protein
VPTYSKGKRVRVVGDVWGRRGSGSVAAQQAQQALADQFRQGDKVFWKGGLFSPGMRQGKITAKDKTAAMVNYKDKDGQQQIDRIAYEKLSKRK